MTCAGVEFVGTIRRVLQEIDIAISVAGVAGLGATGRITVGWYASLSSGELRATLVDYIGRYPAVMVRVVEGGNRYRNHRREGRPDDRRCHVALE